MNVKKIVKILTDRQLYCIIYLIAGLLWCLPLLTKVLDPVCKLCFVWGIGLIVWDVFTKRELFLSGRWFLSIIFLCSYACTVVVTYFSDIQASLYMGIKNMVYSALILLILFAQNRETAKEDILKFLKHVNNSIIGVSLFSGSVSLLFYFFQASIVLYDGEKWFRAGYLENRLFGLYSSANVGGVYALLSVAAVVLNLMITKKSLRECPRIYKVDLIVQIMYFSLTLSNGGTLTTFAFCGMFSLVFLLPEIMRNNHKITKVVFKTAAAMIIMILGSQILIKGVRSESVIVPKTVNWIKEVVTGEGQTEEEEEILFERIESGDDSSNGRFTIWSGGIKNWLLQPLWGISDPTSFRRRTDRKTESFYEQFSEKNVRDVYEPVINLDVSRYTDQEIRWLGIAQNNMHNSYLQILVSSGIAGLLIFILIILFTLFDILKFLVYGSRKGYVYRIVSMLFCVCSALMANGLVEAHLLFKQQDSIGLVFWIYLGSILVLIRKEEWGEEQKGAVMVCHTPIQILNALNLAASDSLNTQGDNLIYINHEFEKAGTYARELRKTGLFREVIEVVPFEEYRGMRHKLAAFKRYLFPGYSLRKHLKKDSSEGTGRSRRSMSARYLVFSIHSPLVSVVRLLYDRTEIVMIDDGVGSYIGDILNDYPSRVFKVLRRYLFNGLLQMHPSLLFLNNKELCETKMKCEVRELEPIKENDRLLSLVEKVFQYENTDQYDRCEFIYLDQPIQLDSDGAKKASDRMWRLFKRLDTGHHILVRPHPRQKDTEYCVPRQTVENMWEIECVEKIKDTHILAGIISTAQFTPLIIGGTEPFVIFLYKILMFGLSESQMEKYNSMAANLSRMYKRPEKVMVPENLEELETILDRLGLL